MVPEFINNSGVIAGYGTEEGVIKGFVYNKGNFIILESPNQPNTSLIGINNDNKVVGIAYNPGRGFVSTICSEFPVRVYSLTSTYYSSIQDAYDIADDGDIIESHNIIFTGNLNFDLNKSVTLSGGHDCDYSVIDGTSIINGDIVVDNGSADVSNVSVK